MLVECRQFLLKVNKSWHRLVQGGDVLSSCRVTCCRHTMCCIVVMSSCRMTCCRHTMCCVVVMSSCRMTCCRHTMCCVVVMSCHVLSSYNVLCCRHVMPCDVLSSRVCSTCIIVLYRGLMTLVYTQEGNFLSVVQ